MSVWLEVLFCQLVYNKMFSLVLHFKLGDSVQIATNTGKTVDCFHVLSVKLKCLSDIVEDFKQNSEDSGLSVNWKKKKMKLQFLSVFCNCYNNMSSVFTQSTKEKDHSQQTTVTGLIDVRDTRLLPHKFKATSSPLQDLFPQVILHFVFKPELL